MFLFVFGELFDAHQSRSMTNAMRVKIAWQTKFFLQAWDMFLVRAEYRSHHGLARETQEILEMVCNSIISLAIIYRDYSQRGNLPLAPWMHSTEANEHTFGILRGLVEDFTVLDFVHLQPKLEALLLGDFKAARSDTKTRASGYMHSYFCADGFDSQEARIFPSDTDISSLAKDGYLEAESLLEHLGIPSIAVLGGTLPAGGLPSISGLQPDDEGSDDMAHGWHNVDTSHPSDKFANLGPEETTVTEQLHQFIEEFGQPPLLSFRCERKFDVLVVGAVAERVDCLTRM